MGGVLRLFFSAVDTGCQRVASNLTVPPTITSFPPTQPRLGCVPPRPDAAILIVPMGPMMRGGGPGPPKLGLGHSLYTLAPTAAYKVSDPARTPPGGRPPGPPRCRGQSDMAIRDDGAIKVGADATRSDRIKSVTPARMTCSRSDLPPQVVCQDSFAIDLIQASDAIRQARQCPMPT